MSEQAPGTGPQGRPMTRQEMLAEMQQALDATVSVELHLAHQREQLERLLARSEEHLEMARRFNDRVMALDALARCQQAE
jgi:hypothetical protein